jgi:hypothetical protein
MFIKMDAECRRKQLPGGNIMGCRLADEVQTPQARHTQVLVLEKKHS